MLKKFLFSLFFFTIILSALMPFFSKRAQAEGWACSIDVFDERGNKLPNGQPTGSNRALKMVIHAGENARSGNFTVALTNTGSFLSDHDLIPLLTETTTSSNGDITVDYFGPNGLIADPNNANLPTFPETTYHIFVYDAQSYILNGLGNKYFGPGRCNAHDLVIKKSNGLGSARCDVKYEDKKYGKSPDDQNFDPTQYLLPGNPIFAKIDICPSGDGPLCRVINERPDVDSFQVQVKDGSGTVITSLGPKSASELKSGIDLGNYVGGSYLLDIKIPLSTFIGPLDTLFDLIPFVQAPKQELQDSIECSSQFKIDAAGGNTGCSTDNDCANDRHGRYCLPDKTGSLSCQASPDGLAINPCVTKGSGYVCQTAIGAIGTSAGTFAKGVLQLFLGLAGVILLFMIILNGYKFMTSQGDPEKVKEARESITSAIAGILVIIFSIVILQLITVDILHLPGFN